MRAPWWQTGVIYQIVIPSFYDSDGDGLGDLEGIRQKLDYFTWLGVDALWLSPLHPSPLLDLGYDVTDYTGVEPRFGGREAFERLLADATARRLKIILDWVPNHTSDQHPWFVESRGDRDHPRRNWYVWRDAKPDGAPPNNWLSVFGGSSWTWDDATQQYYLHSFLAEQPELNWREPALRAAMHDALRFWLDLGVAGFRVDAAAYLVKDAELRDNPPNPAYTPDDAPDQKLLRKYHHDVEEVHEAIAEMRAVVDEYDDRLLAGEFYMYPERLVRYYGVERPEMHLPLNLSIQYAATEAAKLNDVLHYYYKNLPPGAPATWSFGCHDTPQRLTKRMDARVAALLLCTLRGTPTMYYGDELGMSGTEIPREEAIDPQGRRTGRNRDSARTPMQWDDAPHAGFTTGTPWLRLGDDWQARNVERERSDPRSLLNFYRELIALRRATPALVYGDFMQRERANPWIAFERRWQEERWLVVANLGQETATYDLAHAGNIVFATHQRRGERASGSMRLQPQEGVLLRLSP